jgi:PleD family two-component response regulator
MMPQQAVTRAGKPLSRPPLVLIASGQEWSARALDSVLAAHGYDVRIAHNGRQLAMHAHDTRPDVLIIEDNLPDVAAVEACRAVRSDPGVSPSTPILITAAPSVAGKTRIQALTAGAWDVVTLPLNAEELILRLNGYTLAKLEADRAENDESPRSSNRVLQPAVFAPTDGECGGRCAFPAPSGLHRAQAKVETGTEQVWEGEIAWRALTTLAKAIRSTVRTADVAGRVGRTTLAVVASETDGPGTIRLAQRLIEAAAEHAGSFTLRVHAGCSVDETLHEAEAQPVDVLTRATSALRTAQKSNKPVAFFDSDHAAESA